jgi:UDP-3-O-[3-hydroxymyristoyl] glucosamine N-acyltransferase
MSLFDKTRTSSAVESLEDWLRMDRPSSVLVTCFNPQLRRKLVAELTEANVRFETSVPISNWIDPKLVIARGSVIFGPSVIMRGVQIGNFSLVLPDVAIGHDVRIGDFVTIDTCACISGYVEIGDETVVGAGSVIVNGTIEKPLTIGPGVRIAEHTVVTKSIRAGATVAGNPGRVVS